MKVGMELNLTSLFPIDPKSTSYLGDIISSA